MPKPRPIPPLVEQFPDRPVEELTKVAAFFSMIWDNYAPDPRKTYNMNSFCNLVEANVGAPIDRELVLGVVATAHAAQQNGESIVSIMPSALIEE